MSDTTLNDAARYALISLDSTMKSNATVGPPIDLLVYPTNETLIWSARRRLWVVRCRSIRSKRS